eukprot:TRINITY_DN26232_c0_g1_i1.p2 TRINITY_DN26232_c0_g1~~TRINITY_DN26232_c0_g1_i1.p2  ORF type:complete len:111 (+),score=14.21 TRINITY_DN26232_c0_g1_i1:79-411(+)
MIKWRYGIAFCRGMRGFAAGDKYKKSFEDFLNEEMMKGKPGFDKKSEAEIKAKALWISPQIRRDLHAMNLDHKADLIDLKKQYHKFGTPPNDRSKDISPRRGRKYGRGEV